MLCDWSNIREDFYLYFLPSPRYRDSLAEASSSLFAFSMPTGSLAALLQPDLILETTIAELHPSLLEQYHLRGMVLDVDDTLLPTWDVDLPPKILAWLLEIKQQMPIWLVSNNLNHRRIERIAQQVELPFLMGGGQALAA